MNIRQELENTFSELSGELASLKFEEDLDQSVLAFQKHVRQSPFSGGLKKSMPLAKIYEYTGQECARRCAAWLESLQQYRKSMKFRDAFDNSLLVYVYGKVKSGKSAFGNFMAYGRHNPTLEEVQAAPFVEFNVVESKDTSAKDKERVQRLAEKMKSERKFIVDMLECTSCIQYFHKKGLTWVDSPGIHSTTNENGALAQRYLESADLVVYTTTSRSACQDADIRELISIARSGKPFVLAVTRCDERMEDIDAQGNIVTTTCLRSEKDCADIRTYCIESLLTAFEGVVQRELHADTAVLTRDALTRNTLLLSSLYAEEHPDEKGWEDSGMAEFARRLIAIALSNAKQMKLQAPLTAMLKHIDDMLYDLQVLKDEVKKAEQAVEEQQGRLCAFAQRQIYECRLRFQQEMNSLVEKFYGDNAAFRKEASRLGADALLTARVRLVQEILESTDNMLAQMPFAIDLSSAPGFEDITQTVTYHTSRKKGWGTALGGLIGAVVGLAAGPVGAVVGAMVGGGGGGFVGSQFDGADSSSAKVGDNRQDVARAIVAQLTEHVEADLHNFSRAVQDACSEPLVSWFKNLAHASEKLETTLRGQVERIRENANVHNA